MRHSRHAWTARLQAMCVAGTAALLVSQPSASQSIPARKPVPAVPPPIVLAQSVNIPLFEFRMPRPAAPQTQPQPRPAPQAQPVATPSAPPSAFKVPTTDAERRALFERIPESAELRQLFISDIDTFIGSFALLAAGEKTPALIDKAFADFRVAEAVSALVDFYNRPDSLEMVRANKLPRKALMGMVLTTFYIVYAGPDGYAKVKPLLTPQTTQLIMVGIPIACRGLLKVDAIQQCSARAADYEAPGGTNVAARDAPPGYDLPPLMEGGADALFDVLGVSPGMDCEVAKVRIQAAFGRVQGYPLQDVRRSRYAKAEGARTEFDYRLILQRSIDAAKDEEIRIECSLKDDLGQVYQIYRRWTPQPSNPAKPTIAQLKAQLEEKYGRFRSDFTRPDGNVAVFANLYNNAGRISGPNEACGPFLHNNPAGAIAVAREDPDPARCSFAIYAVIEPYMSDRSRVGKLELTIWDYGRFGKLAAYNMLRKQEMQKAAPGQGPRL